MLKYSRQREMIENYLKNTKEHPTAERIFSQLKKEDPAFSLATVYRNLNLLCANGIVQKFSIGKAEDRFDYDTSDHGHFICDRCGSVSDFYTPAVNLSAVLGELEVGTEIHNHKLFVYGQCKDCKK